MLFSAFKLHVARKLASSATLAAFGQPFVYDPLARLATVYTTTTHEATPTLVKWTEAGAQRMRETGVALQVGPPRMEEIENTATGGLFGRLVLDIDVGESFEKAHAPAGDLLVDAVLAALISDNGGRPVELIAVGEPLIDQGMVWRQFTVAAPARHG